MGVQVSERLVAVLMSINRIAGLPSVGKVKRLRGVVSAGDLVNRKFHRPHPNELWVTDITGTQAVHIMSIYQQNQRSRNHGLIRLSGDGLDNAMMESFWSSAKIELLNRKRKENPDRVSLRKPIHPSLIFTSKG
jgi:hypothetical protein